MAYGIPTLPCHLFMTEPHSNLKLTLYIRYWLSSLPRLSFRSYCASKDIQLPMKISDIPRKTRAEDLTMKLLLHESTSRDANVYKGMDIKLWWAKCHQDVTVLQRNIQVVPGFSAGWLRHKWHILNTLQRPCLRFPPCLMMTEKSHKDRAHLYFPTLEIQIKSLRSYQSERVIWK